MSDKKHIDRVFQEKLKDFEASPNPKVWKNIQSKLDEPKDDEDKIFPFWWKIGGVAAILLILLTIGNLFISNQNNTIETNVVDTEKTTITPNSGNINKTTTKQSKNPFKAQKPVVETKTSSQEEANKNVKNSIAISNASEVTNTSNKNAAQNKKTYPSVTGNKKQTTTLSKVQIVKANSNATTYSNTNKVASNNNTSLNKNFNKLQPNKEKNITPIANSNTYNKNNNTVAKSVTQLDKAKVDSELNQNTTNTITQTTEEENTNTEILKEDKKETTIEEEIAKVEELIENEEDKKIKRWQVYANIAPVYYNTLGKGSHIDAQFVDNSKSGELNTSYGVNVSYAFNEKLKLRSGLNSLNLSYDTDNVILYPNVSSSSTNSVLKNVTFTSEQAVSAISATNLGVQQALGLLPSENAAISQRLGYYEIPVELEYILSNKKFGVNVIAGLSTMILNHNKIFSEFEGRKTEVGEANNINDLSFTGNLGLGLNYKFSDKVKFNVEPTFKYQMNAYENTSGNFRPYIIGLYTGLSYKF